MVGVPLLVVMVFIGLYALKRVRSLERLVRVQSLEQSSGAPVVVQATELHEIPPLVIGKMVCEAHTNVQKL